MVTVNRYDRIPLHGVYKWRVQSGQKLLGLSHCVVHPAHEFCID